MVYVEAEGTPRGRVRISADLARKFNATLLGISARATRPLMTGDGIVATVLLDASIPEIEAKLTEKAKWFHCSDGRGDPCDDCAASIRRYHMRGARYRTPLC
jgi:hypothetical protein